MEIYVEINGTKYPASITGRLHDGEWDNRASKAITVEMDYQDAVALFVDDIEWKIIQEYQEMTEQFDEFGNLVVDEKGNAVLVSTTKSDEYDNSEYSIAGDIIDHRNGKVTVKMGQPTAEELLAMFEEALL